jgi:hypothetical protein
MSEQPVTRRQALTLLGAGAGGGAVFGLALKGLLADEHFDVGGARFTGGAGEVAIEADGAHGLRALSGGWSPEPPIRLRISREKPDTEGARHFMAIPYEYGMAMEYDGIVECWVKEWSIHNNSRSGSADGAVLWVGNHDDTGGLRLTGYHRDGVRYGQIATELFHESGAGGDLRLLVHEPGEAVEIRSGHSGRDRPVFRVSAGEGLELRSADGPAFRVSPNGELRAKGRVVATGGLGVGTARPSGKLGAVRHRVPLHDEAGKLLGYLPVHELS